MKTILKDRALEVYNNSAEMAIKSFIIGTKNWLFANTGRGANLSAIIYRIIEITKSPRFSVEKYLVYLRL